MRLFKKRRETSKYFRKPNAMVWNHGTELLEGMKSGAPRRSPLNLRRFPAKEFTVWHCSF